MLSEPLLVLARLARTFDELAIRYVVGGSLAMMRDGRGFAISNPTLQLP